MNICRPFQKLGDRLYENSDRELPSVYGNILEAGNMIGCTAVTMIMMANMLTESHTPSGASGTSLLLFFGSTVPLMATVMRVVEYSNIEMERRWQHIASELIDVSARIKLLKLQNATPTAEGPSGLELQ